MTLGIAPPLTQERIFLDPALQAGVLEPPRLGIQNRADGRDQVGDSEFGKRGSAAEVLCLVLRLYQADQQLIGAFKLEIHRIDTEVASVSH